MYKNIYIGFSFPHHGEHAGYDQIKKYLKYDRIIDCQKSLNFLEWITYKHPISSKIYGKLFGGRLWWVELQLIVLSILNPNKFTFHIIYGENIFKHLGYFKFGNKIVLTLHQPPSFFEDPLNKSFLNKLDKVDKLIVMSSDMEVYFKNKFHLKKVLFIPHGIETDYFTPKGTKNNQILLVGSWLRDFEFASKVFSMLKEITNDLSIKVVTNKKNHFYFNNNIQLMDSISDDELLKLYQASKIVFLPLKQFTANNAILEACSCGCQVIVATSINNINRELNSPIKYEEFNLNNVINEIIKYIELWNNNSEQINRNFAITNYDWKIIAKKTLEFIKY